jgi:hypothetical protein
MINENGEVKVISAKEAFEATKGRAQKIKQEKLTLVNLSIRQATDREQLSTSFNFIQLKPFVGVVIEKLTELGYKVTQAGQLVTVSWDLSPKTSTKAKAVAEAVVVAAEMHQENYYEDAEDDDEDEYDDGRF